MGYLHIHKFVFAILFILSSCTLLSAENYKSKPDTLAITIDHGRYAIEVNERQEALVLTDLQPGVVYRLSLIDEYLSNTCSFRFFKNQESQIIRGTDHSKLAFKAQSTSETIFIQSENCKKDYDYQLTLSVVKTIEPAEAPARSLMGITTDPNYSAEELIQDIFIGGGCFEVSNVQVIGSTLGIGAFGNGTSSVGIDEGIVLTSGNIGTAAGPNNISNSGTDLIGVGGDQDLNILATGNVEDAVGIEFDFTPVVNTIQFRYVFASEEYCDFVGTNFNDVFGFFISGPGINGAYTNNGENIAIVPGTNQDVSINNVNIQTNAAYYVDNVPVGQFQPVGGGCVAADLNNPGAAETEIEYDGFTTVLTATANVQACETYRIRMVVGDVGDGIYDSAVFLEANSFDLGGDVSLDIDLPGLGSTGVAYEGCTGDGFIIFERPDDANISLPFDVYFTVSPSSTATNGLDFNTLPPFVTIPAGQTQYLLPLSIYEDFLDEGTETLIIELNNPCTCQDASVEVQISDTPPLNVTTPDLFFCNETNTTLFADVGGGVPGYDYQWSTGGTGPAVNVDVFTGTQTFSVTITDECGNQEVSTSTVTVAEEAYAVLNGFAEVCEANPNGVLTINFTGNGPWDLIYMIDAVPQQPLIGITDNPYFLVVSEPGIYTISSVSVDGCPGIGDGSGIITPTLFNSFVIPTPVSCPENFDGSIDFVITGGAPEYSFEWSNDFYTEDIDNLGPGAYTVTVTDLNGCTHIDSGEVLAPDSIIATITPVQGVDCIDSLSGVADLTVTGGSPDFTYEWDNGSTEEDPDNLSAGPHTVTVTDAAGCIAEAAVTISQDAQPPVAVADVSGIITCDNTEALLDGTASSGGTDLEYTWLDNTGTIISGDVSINVENAGTYTLVVTNLQNGCSDQTDVLVEEALLPPVPNATGGLLTCTETEVMLSAEGSTGQGTLAYAWFTADGSPLGITEMLEVTESGTYTLILTDGSNGCTAETTADVTLDDDLPVPEATPSGILNCNTDMIIIDGAGSTAAGTINYAWSDEAGDPLGTASEIEVTTSGTYTLVITDMDNGCTAQITAEVDQNIMEPIPDAVADGLVDCITITVLLDGSGSTGGELTYQWLDGATEISTESSVEVMDASTYTLVITDTENGCTAETTVDVDENQVDPIPAATVSDILTCDVLETTLDASTSSGNGNLTYEWTASDGTPVGSTPEIMVENTGSYTVVITDDSNGCTAETMVTVEEDIIDPIADAGEDDILNCDATSVSLNGEDSSTGTNISYDWFNEGNVNIGTEISVDVMESGTYTLIVTNTDNGCTNAAEVVIDTDENVPDIDAVVDGIIDCTNTIVTLDGSSSEGNGPLAFQWLDATNTEITTDEITTVENTGIYTLIITDEDNGCTAQSTVEVLDNLLDPIALIADPDLLTCTNDLVELNAAASTGSGTLTYQWENSAGGNLGITSTIDVMDAGTYEVMVTDTENGCTSSTTVMVDENTITPSPDAVSDDILTCEILNVTLDGGASTGLGDLTYEWLDDTSTPIGTTVSNEVNTPGVYTLIITDDLNGCTSETTVNVEQDIVDPTALATADGLLNCAVSMVELDGTGSTGAHDLNYQWISSDGTLISTNPMIETPDAGTYTLIVTDQVNACTQEVPVSVDANFDQPNPVADADGMLTCENLSVVIDGSSSTSAGGLSYIWTDENNITVGTEASLEVNATGTYTLQLMDTVSFCTETLEVAITEDIAAPIADAGPESTLTCDIETVSLNGENSSTGSNITYEWINAGGVTVGALANVDVSEAGLYSLVVTNTSNGCTANSTVEVVPDENLPNADAGLGSLLTCDILEATLNGENSSTGTNISYEWLAPDGTPLNSNLEIIVNDPGTYTLVVTDGDNGCSATASVEVDQDIIAPQADPGNSPTITCNQTEVSLSGIASTASSGILTYEWLDDDGNSIGTDSVVQVDMAGMYTLVVTGENACTNTAAIEVLLDADVPVADPGDNEILDCSTPLVMLGGLNTSTGNDISYQWLNANNELVGTEQFLEVESPDTYTLIVFNASNNCETSAQAIVEENVLLPQVDVGAGGLLTCVNEQITLGGVGTSVGLNFEYEWTDANAQVISTDSSYNIAIPGTYTLTVFNTENGCSTTEAITIDQNIQTPVADAGAGGILTCEVTELTLDASGSSGSNLTFQWLNEMGVPVDTEPQIEVGETGQYTLVVTNTTNGCTAMDRVDVIPDENLPTAIATEDGVLNCTVEQVMIDAGSSSSISGNLTFEWLNPEDDFLSNDPNLLVAMPGIYTVIVSDTDNGCTTTALVEVLQDIENPQALAGANDTLTCTITELQLNGSGANGTNLSYNWFDSNNTPIGQTAEVLVNTAGTYTLIVTNQDNACTAIDQVEIIPDTDLPLANAGTAETLTCVTESVLLDASSSDQSSTITYEWQDVNGNTLSNALQLEVSNPGVYTIIVTDTENSCVAQDAVVVPQDINNPNAAIDGIGDRELNCDVEAVLLNAENSTPFSELSFAWSTTDGNISTATDLFEIQADESGMYTLVVTNQNNGCTSTETYVVSENTTLPALTINDPPVLTCYNTQVVINAANLSGLGNFEYTWTAINGSGIVTANDLDLLVNAPGTYTLTIENLDNGCEQSELVEVTADQVNPEAEASSNDVLDCVTTSVGLDGSGSSTGSIYAYQWEGAGILSGANTLQPTVGQVGTYTLTVTNTQNGCTESTEVFVFENNNVPSDLVVNMSPPACAGDNGSIEILSVQGGEGPYLYSLDGGDNFYDITFFGGLDPDTYELVVQDAIGCEYDQLINIPFVEDIYVETSVELETDLEIELGDTVQLLATSNYEEWELANISWTSSESLSCNDCLTPIAFPNQTTTYQITIVNENGCPATDEITLRVNKKRGIFIPNVFSPGNNDDINDIFHIFSDQKSVRNIETFQVFDRWGELVFENYDFMPDDPAQGWDGTLRGERMNPAVFVYWAKIEFIDGQVVLFKGDVTLVR